jgi:peptidoglycan/xylan/chitin deacetylase (PgdA/CDA1 family)
MRVLRCVCVITLGTGIFSVMACVAATIPTTNPSTPTLTPIVLRPSDPIPTAMPTSVASVTLTPFPIRSSDATTQAIAILMYHQIKELPASASAYDLDWTVSPAALDAQLNYLATKGYVAISLDQALDGLAGHAPLPAKAVVLTFDDGWKTQYTHALPLLKKYKQTATFYIVSSYMGYGAYFDWTMTEELRRAGMTIGVHTIDHADLTKKSLVELDRQVRDSKAVLEKKLNVAVTHFAYPFGAHNETVMAALKHAGYRSAVTINPALLKNPVSPYLLPRIRVSYKETLADFAKKLPQ